MVVEEWIKRDIDYFLDGELLELRFNLAFECNSYNVEKPENPETYDVNTDHDGVYVHCKLDDNTIVKYWGD